MVNPKKDYVSKARQFIDWLNEDEESRIEDRDAWLTPEQLDVMGRIVTLYEDNSKHITGVYPDEWPPTNDDLDGPNLDTRYFKVEINPLRSTDKKSGLLDKLRRVCTRQGLPGEKLEDLFGDKSYGLGFDMAGINWSLLFYLAENNRPPMPELK